MVVEVVVASKNDLSLSPNFLKKKIINAELEKREEAVGCCRLP